MAMAELSIEQIDDALERGSPHFLVHLLKTTGSTPRNEGSVMLVGDAQVYGTIGGGSAEWVAVQTVREFIRGADVFDKQSIVLGPDIDQCCGGTIEVRYTRLTAAGRKSAVALVTTQPDMNVLIFGAGHTGIALANAFAPLRAKVQIIDSRPDYATNSNPHPVQCLAMPETAVNEAVSGSIFLITTHDHSLDFMITAQALDNPDAAYVGMIGSSTKRAVLKSWMGSNGYDPELIDKLHCPIGDSIVKNKQPEIIAAMTVAEVLKALVQ